MLDGGDARLEHLKRGVERVQVGIDVARDHAAREPELERMIGRAELERRQAHMVMRVDEARDDHVLGRAQDLVGTVTALEFGVGPDLDHDAVALEDGAVRDDPRVRAAVHLDHDVLAPDQRGRQDGPLRIETRPREGHHAGGAATTSS